jgi:hypothetical protein
MILIDANLFSAVMNYFYDNVYHISLSKKTKCSLSAIRINGARLYCYLQLIWF